MRVQLDLGAFGIGDPDNLSLTVAVRRTGTAAYEVATVPPMDAACLGGFQRKIDLTFGRILAQGRSYSIRLEEAGGFDLMRIDGQAMEFTDANKRIGAGLCLIAERLFPIVLQARAILEMDEGEFVACVEQSSAAHLRWLFRTGRVELFRSGVRRMAVVCSCCGKTAEGNDPGPGDVCLQFPREYRCGWPLFGAVTGLVSRAAAAILARADLPQMRRLRDELRILAIPYPVAIPADDAGDPWDFPILLAPPEEEDEEEDGDAFAHVGQVKEALDGFPPILARRATDDDSMS